MANKRDFFRSREQKPVIPLYAQFKHLGLDSARALRKKDRDTVSVLATFRPPSGLHSVTAGPVYPQYAHGWAIAAL